MFTIPPLRYLLPNMFTLAATFCGMAIIWLSATATDASHFYFAALLVPIACVLDGFDGRVARWVDGQSEIGVQLDSMSDLVTFGIAPSFLVYFWALEAFGFGGLLLAFVFAAGAMLRLARFNVMAVEDGGCTRYFTGLPAPMGGMGIAAMVCIDTTILARDTLPAQALPGVVGFVLLLSLLMVSNVPFRTFKDLRFTPLNVLFVGSVFAILITISVTVDPLVGLSVMYFGYFVSNLLGALFLRRRRLAGGRYVIEEDDGFEVYEESDEADTTQPL